MTKINVELTEAEMYILTSAFNSEIESTNQTSPFDSKEDTLRSKRYRKKVLDLKEKIGVTSWCLKSRKQS